MKVIKYIYPYFYPLLFWASIFHLYQCKSSDVMIIKKQRDVNLAIRIAKIDQLGNVILLDRKNQISLFTRDLNKKYEYADNTLGKITHVDITDPLKIVIYKKDYGLVILLDNTLTEIDHLNLYELGFQGISVVATALDGNLWVYDIADYKLKKISPQGKILLKSNNLVDLGLQNLQPDFLQEKQGKLVLKDPDVGILLFDNLGQWIQTFPFKVNSDLQFDGQNIVFWEENHLLHYDTKLYEEKTIPLETEKVTSLLMDVKIGLTHYYYIYKDGVDLLELNKK